jgi:2-dehydropantoate 2-reductase
MRFAVVGAGAVGGFVGGCLARGGSDVILIARGEHLRAIQDQGLRIMSDRDDDFVAHLPATSDLEATSDADVVFVGLKAYSLPEVAPRLADSLKSTAAVIPAQNGLPWWYFQGLPGPLSDLALQSVDPGGVIGRAIGHERVVGCVVYCSTELVEPGVIRHIEGTRFAIGEPSGYSSERCRAIAQAFLAGGLKCPVESRLRDHIWLKLIGNAALNPVTALTGATLAEVARSPEAKDLVHTIMEECALVARAIGVELPISIDRRLEAALAVGDHKTSMLQDREAGKPLEVDCMTGAVIEIANTLSVPVPNTRAVHACIKALEELRQASGRRSLSQEATAG